MLTAEAMKRSPLFQGIEHTEYLAMVECFQAVHKTFRPGEVIYSFDETENNAVGIVEKGSAALIRIDEEGISTVLENLDVGGIFGKGLAFAPPGLDSLEVVCRTACEVLFIDYPHILKRCERACHHHSQLVQNMLQLVADKAQNLSEHVDVLSRRSIREKLLCYFHQLAEKEGGDSFVLPFSLSTLADYIATDRSAMMRELKRLRDEGIVTSNGRQFTLHE